MQRCPTTTYLQPGTINVLASLNSFFPSITTERGGGGFWAQSRGFVALLLKELSKNTVISCLVQTIQHISSLVLETEIMAFCRLIFPTRRVHVLHTVCVSTNLYNRIGM